MIGLVWTWLMENYWVLLTTIIAIANVIAKVTPNEVDDKWVHNIHKVVDLFAMSTGKTRLKSLDTE